MFLDTFIVPRKLGFNEDKARRVVQSSKSITKRFWKASNWKQINNTRKESLFYAVVYDDEWFDSRLIQDLKCVLVSSLNVDMFSLFCARGDGKVIFQPRVFRSDLKLSLDITNQPLPEDHEVLIFEKLLGGWLYVD